MKKFISMVMAAAMVVTMVPATAFAANTVTAKVVNPLEVTANEVENLNSKDISELAAAQNTARLPQLQLKVTDADSLQATDDAYEVTLTFGNFDVESGAITAMVYRAEDGNNELVAEAAIPDGDINTDKDKVTFSFEENGWNLQAGDIIAFNLDGDFKKAKVGSEATVKVSGGDFGTTEEYVFASVVEKGIKVELDDDVVNVAPEEYVVIDDVVVKPTAGYEFSDVLTVNVVELPNGTEIDGVEVTLKLNKGFEFVGSDDPETTANVIAEELYIYDANDNRVEPTCDFDGDEVTFWLSENGNLLADTKWVISGLVVEATTADAGDTAVITVKADRVDAVKVEVAKVVDMKVVMSLVDEDEDVPTFYNGVNVQNEGLTAEDDHVSLEVSIKETFAGAWSNHKDFTLTLPEGVHVVAVDAEDVEAGFTADGGDDDLVALFGQAYQNGDHEYFKFKKRTFEETHVDGVANEIKFTMTLVADPDFTGDVVLTLEGAALDTQEVVIAKVLAPYTIKAEQNDVIIDYRYTEIPTDIVITEAEAGLWEEDLEVTFEVEESLWIRFEDTATVEVNEESGMEIDEAGVNDLGFEVTEESEDEPAVVTISGIELFMQRSIPAGPYSLDVAFNTALDAFEQVVLFAPDCGNATTTTCGCTRATDSYECATSSHECVVADVADYSSTVHEAWVNVVTAGRDQDDASFTTKIVVPVGETTMYAGEKAITLDVPAYINANDYVMLPVRAVATALGIDNNAVQWDQATKTVIIMYGQRIITMTAGQSVVYVSGTAIPAKAAVEIVDGRAFLGLRDLATTLGISNINYDATTKTATLN